MTGDYGRIPEQTASEGSRSAVQGFMQGCAIGLVVACAPAWSSHSRSSSSDRPDAQVPVEARRAEEPVTWEVEIQRRINALAAEGASAGAIVAAHLALDKLILLDLRPRRVLVDSDGALDFYFFETARAGHDHRKYASLGVEEDGSYVALLGDRVTAESQVWEIEDDALESAIETIQGHIS